MPNGVTITLAATKSETSTTDFAAFAILGEVVKYVTQTRRLLFSAARRRKINHRYTEDTKKAPE